jgi:prepilin-type N-terminal cleavage/methylation domain-containing protein
VSTRRRKEQGFTLLELSIVLFIGAGFLTAMTLAQHLHMLQLRAQAMAQRYHFLQAGVQRYVELYRMQLLDLPAGCGAPAYQTDSAKPPDGAVAAGNCQLQLSTAGRLVKVSNGLQPMAEELRDLGLVDAGASVGLALDREQRVFSPAFSSSGARLAPDQLGVLVRKSCLSPSCTGPVTFESLVFNLQPYLLSGGNWALDRRDQVRLLVSQLGEGAALSQAAEQGALVGDTFTWVNPVQELGSLRGAPGIVALRSSSQASLDALWARRDGQSQISGDWDFSSNRLTGVSNLNAQTLEARDLQLTGQADLNTASIESLAANRLQAQQLRLPAAQIDQVCDPARGNVALDADTGRLLTCTSPALRWSMP